MSWFFSYAGQYAGVRVYESSLMGTGGIALPPLLIIIGKGAYSKSEDPDLIMHEFGHFLQARQIGFFRFYLYVGLPSLWSAYRAGRSSHIHMKYWTECWANDIASQFFSKSFINPQEYRCILKNLDPTWPLNEIRSRYKTLLVE